MTAIMLFIDSGSANISVVAGTVTYDADGTGPGSSPVVIGTVSASSTSTT